jgi:hypothetical protein
VIALTLVPVALAQRLTRDTGALRPVGGGPGARTRVAAEEPPGG